MTRSTWLRGRWPSRRDGPARWVVFTCVTGGYDRVLPPLERTPGARFVLFSDDPGIRVRGWETRPLAEFAPADGPLANRAHKMLGARLFPDCRATLYVDGSVHILSDLTPLFEAFEASDSDIGLPLHPQRTRVAEEVEACIDHGKADPDALRREYANLLSEGLDPEAALTENNILFRRPGPRVDTAMEEWWERVSRGSGRDQLSLPLVLARHGLRVMHLPVDGRNPNPWFRRYLHIGAFPSRHAWRRHVLKSHRDESAIRRLRVRIAVGRP